MAGQGHDGMSNGIIDMMKKMQGATFLKKPPKVASMPYTNKMVSFF